MKNSARLQKTPRFYEHAIKLLGFGLSFLHRHLPLILKISLVAHYDNDHFAASLVAHVIVPFVQIGKRIAVCSSTQTTSNKQWDLYEEKRIACELCKVVDGTDEGQG